MANPLTRLRMALGAAAGEFWSSFTRDPEGDSYLTPGIPAPSRQGMDGEPRLFPYEPAINVQVEPRGELPTSFGILRQLADACDVVRIAIEFRKEQLKGLRWTIGPADLEQTTQYQTEIKLLTDFFTKPDRIDDWDEWLGKVLEEVLVTDAMTLYRRLTRGGALWALEPIDGATIKPLVDTQGRIPRPPLPAYSQFLYGRPDGHYTTRQIIYKPKVRRTHKMYGFGPVEQTLLRINQALRHDTYATAWFTEGNTPNGMITSPEKWEPDQLKAYQKQWDLMMAGRDQHRHRIKWVPFSAKYQPFKEYAFDKDFADFVVTMVAASFQVPLQIFGIQSYKTSAEEEGNQQHDSGLQPLKQYVARLINGVIHGDLGFTDLHFAFVEDKASKTLPQAQKNVALVSIGAKLIDDVRRDEGLPPLGGWAAKPLIITKNGATPLDMIGDLAQAQVALGQPAGEDEEDDDDDDVAANKIEKAAKVSQDDADYIAHTTGDKPCDKCVMFRAPHGCTKVRGTINADGHCRFWSPKDPG